MKVLIISETLQTGGAEIFVLRLANALKQEDIGVKVVNLNKEYENEEIVNNFPDISIERLSLRFPKLIDFIDKIFFKLNIDYSLRYAIQTLQLTKLISSYDIVHTHYIQVDYLISRLKRKFSFKHVITMHGDYSPQYEAYQQGELRFWLRFDQKLDYLVKNTDQWVAITDQQREFLLNKMLVPDNKINKIYNGYAGSGIGDLKKSSAEFTVGMLSRGHPQKGWQLLIDAFLKLPVGSRLLLVGCSNYLDELKKKYENEKRIVFTGFQADPKISLQKMDVFVLPTLFPFEALPNTIVEALYYNVPVITFDIGELKKMITNEETGEMAGSVITKGSNEQNINVLAETLLNLYYHPEILERMRKNSVGAFKKFSMKTCVDSYKALYARLFILNS